MQKQTLEFFTVKSSSSVTEVEEVEQLAPSSV
jgi:hypothetical protein